MLCAPPTATALIISTSKRNGNLRNQEAQFGVCLAFSLVCRKGRCATSGDPLRVVVTVYITPNLAVLEVVAIEVLIK